jgi:nucleolin
MNKQKRQNQDSDDDVSDSLSDSKQNRGKRGREEKSEGKQDRRPRKDSDDGSVEEESKGSSEGHSELFVKNLSYDSNEKSLKSFFSKYGSVTNVKLLKRDDGKPKGIGFVGFSSRKEAQKAIDDADNLECDGRKIGVSFSNEKPSSRDNGNFKQRGNERGGNDRDRGGNRDSGNTVFMGNLSFKTSEDSIRKFFRDCGKIADIRIAKTPEGKMKGFCHVEFDDNDGASSACQKNGEELDERQVRIDMSRPQGPKSFGSGGDRRGGFGGGRRGGDRGGRGFGGRGRGRGGYGGGRNYNDDDD